MITSRDLKVPSIVLNNITVVAKNLMKQIQNKITPNKEDILPH